MTTATAPRAGAASTSLAARVEDDPFFGSTIALTALTMAAAIGMARLFADGSFLFPVCAAAIAGHAGSWWARRVGLGLAAGLLVGAGATALVVAWCVLPHTTAYGFPGPGTWRAVSDELSKSWAEFSKVVAPAPVTKGFLIASVAGVGITAALADWAAYRVRATFEPLLPPFTLFLFGSALGADRNRGISMALFVTAALFFLIVHRAALRSDTTAWFASRSRGGVGALLQGGAVLGLVAVMAAVVIGPRMPGAEAKGLISWRNNDRGDQGSRITTSPLVDIRGRLVRQSNIEVFTVKASDKAYWQLTTLDTFNGSIWSSNTTYRAVKQNLPGGVGRNVQRRTIVQEFSITGLDAIWLPAAYRAERIEGVSGVSYNEELGSLISKQQTSDGLVYTVESHIPEFNPEALNRADPTELPDERFLVVPRLPAEVTREANRIVDAAGAQTNYQKAKALQDHLRTFTYDLNVRPGHDERAMVNFLTRTKRGYCEQFAGTFAAMARALGIPSRVAVGFTPGDIGEDGLYHVRGLNAHAWPEVWLGEYGWVAFEPTPNRGRPGAEQYTLVPEMQAAAGGDSTPATTAPTTTPTTAPAGGATPTTQPRDPEVDTGGEFDLPEEEANPFLRVLAIVGGAALLWLIAVPLLLRRRRVRRRAAASTPVDRVLVAWVEAGEALSKVGTPPRPSETVLEYARRGPRAAQLDDEAAAAMSSLAQQAAVASYSDGALPTETVARAITAAGAIEAAVAKKAGWRRLLWWVDPRPLAPERTREITGKAGSHRQPANVG